MSARTHKPPHGGRPADPAPRELRPPPPPIDPVYPDLPARYGGPDTLADELDELDQAERILGYWPARYQGDLSGAIDHVRRRQS